MRIAEHGDSRAVYDISMQPSVRASSTRSDHFTLAEHERWWARRTAEPTTRLWVAESGSGLAGYVRYGSGPPAPRSHAEIAIAVHDAWRRVGVARRLLLATMWPACAELDVSYLRALIVEDNAASEALFRSVGFLRDGRQKRLGKMHSAWLWARP